MPLRIRSGAPLGPANRPRSAQVGPPATQTLVATLGWVLAKSIAGCKCSKGTSAPDAASPSSPSGATRTQGQPAAGAPEQSGVPPSPPPPASPAVSVPAVPELPPLPPPAVPELPPLPPPPALDPPPPPVPPRPAPSAPARPALPPEPPRPAVPPLTAPARPATPASPPASSPPWPPWPPPDAPAAPAPARPAEPARPGGPWCGFRSGEQAPNTQVLASVSATVQDRGRPGSCRMRGMHAHEQPACRRPSATRHPSKRPRRWWERRRATY